MRLLAAFILLAGCTAQQPADDGQRSAGNTLETAAIAAGLVADPATAALDGAWARDTDRACIVPKDDGGHRIGVLVDYGEGQGCAGSGEVKRRGAGLSISLGDCRFDAQFDGDRIVFPTVLPDACDALCRGRASLASMTVERVSGSISEAQTLGTSNGRLLCRS